MNTPSDWEKKDFCELGQCIRGVSYKPDQLQEAASDSSVVLLRSNNIRDGKLNFDDLQFVDRSAVHEHQKLQRNDIAICMSNGNRALVGKSGQFHETDSATPLAVGAFCSIFRPFDEYDAQFVRYLFGSDSYQQQLDGILSGSAINNLKDSDIVGLTAVCPKHESEQTKIAEILSTVDQAIEQTEALIAKQQRIKTGLMQDLLTRGIDENGNLRSEETHEFKDSLLGRIPVEWEIRSLEELTTKIVDGVHHTPAYVDSGTPFIVVTDLTKGPGIDFSTKRFVSEKDHREFFKRADPVAGDILVTKDGTLGVARIVEKNAPPFSIFVSVAMLRPQTKFCLPELIWSFFDSGQFLRQLGALSAGTGLAHIHLEHFRRFLLRLPPLQEQKQIFQVIAEHGFLLRQEFLRLSKLESLKTALMQDLLTGKVSVAPLLTEEEDSV